MNKPRPNKFGRLAMATALLATLAPPAAMAATPRETIAARQASFKKMGAAVKALKDQLALSSPAKGVLTSNAAIVATTAKEQGKLFTAGTGPGPGVDTDALANIWTDRATFDRLMSAMVAETAKLQAVAGGSDIAAIRAQFRATGQSCAECHRKFRADD
jgi:cytochrome c556